MLLVGGGSCESGEGEVSSGALSPSVPDVQLPAGSQQAQQLSQQGVIVGRRRAHHPPTEPGRNWMASDPLSGGRGGQVNREHGQGQVLALFAQECLRLQRLLGSLCDVSFIKGDLEILRSGTHEYVCDLKVK